MAKYGAARGSLILANVLFVRPPSLLAVLAMSSRTPLLSLILSLESVTCFVKNGFIMSCLRHCAVKVARVANDSLYVLVIAQKGSVLHK